MNARQIAFCQHYVLTRNAAEAARLAGYSARTADRQGYRLLRNAEILANIQDIEKAQQELRILSYNEACAMLSKIARTSIVDFTDEHGKLTPSSVEQAVLKRPELSWAASQIKCHTSKSRQGLSISFGGAQLKAMELLMKLKGWDKGDRGASHKIEVIHLRPLKEDVSER